MRLLLIEDNPRLAELIMQGMVGQGFAVDHCSTLGLARRTLASGPYDLILLDLGLPDGDGLSLIRELRGRAISTRVLTITW